MTSFSLSFPQLVSTMPTILGRRDAGPYAAIRRRQQSPGGSDSVNGYKYNGLAGHSLCLYTHPIQLYHLHRPPIVQSPCFLCTFSFSIQSNRGPIFFTKPNTQIRMQTFKTTALASLLASTAFAADVTKREVSVPDQISLASAVNTWHDDTVAVSGYLDSTQTLLNQFSLNPSSFSNIEGAATPALASEENELSQKSAIETILCNSDSSCNTFSAALGAARTKLEGGPFDSIMAQLKNLNGTGTNGDSVPSFSQTQDSINTINAGQDSGDVVIEGRCRAVLPGEQASVLRIRR